MRAVRIARTKGQMALQFLKAMTDNGRFLRHPSVTEPKDVESPEIVPRDRRLNKERACAAVSIGSIRGGKIQCSNPVNAVKGKRPQRKNHVGRPVALDYV